MVEKIAMMSSQKWWQARRPELLALAQDRCPLFVFNEETLHDTLFDLLAMDAVERVFYPVRVNPHPAILDRVHALGAGFKCAALSELERVVNAFPRLGREGVLFVPEDQSAGDREGDASSGFTVALQPFLLHKAGQDLLRGKKILLWLKKGFRSRPLRKGDSREQRPPEIEMEELAGPMKRFGLSIRGIHISMHGERTSFRDFEETLPAYLMEITRVFEHRFILSLGDGLGVIPDSDRGGVDIEATAANLDAVKEICPHAEIWLEPGPWAVSRAGILLVRTGKIHENEDGLFVETDQGPEGFTISRTTGIPHEVLRLLEGEILVVTNMGAHGPRSVYGSRIRDFVPEHYLKARSVCPVKI